MRRKHFKVFDHCYPPDRGYGYVAASRLKSRDHQYGSLRRADRLAVGRGDEPGEQTVRGPESQSDDEDFDPKPWELESESEPDSSAGYSSAASVEDHSMEFEEFARADGVASEFDAYRELGARALE